jgi:hypothetical protein
MLQSVEKYCTIFSLNLVCLVRLIKMRANETYSTVSIDKNLSDAFSV